MTKQFIGCFGTTKHMQKFRITYLFDEKNRFCLNKDGYVLFSFNDILKMKLKSFIFRQEEACWLLCQSSCMISLLVKWI